MLFLDNIRRVRQRLWLRFLLAVAIFAVALGVRIILDPLLQGIPFATLYPAIVIAGLLGGVWLGFGSTVLSAFVAWYWLLPPIGSFFRRRARRTLNALLKSSLRRWT
jgi:two-component system CheB/CheR fusion protein